MGGFAFSKDGDPIMAGAEWKVIDTGSDGHQIIYTSRAQVLPNVVSPQHSLIINFRDVGRNPRGIGYVSAVAPGTKFYASLAADGRIEYVVFLHPKIGKVDVVLVNPNNCVALRGALEAKSNDELVLKAAQCQNALDQMLPTRPMGESAATPQDHPILQEARRWLDQLSQTIYQSPFSRTPNSTWIPGESFGYNFANWARLCSTVPSFAAHAGVAPGLTAISSKREERAPAKVKETPKETPKETVKETSKEVAKETTKETAKDAPKDAPKESSKDTPKETPAATPSPEAKPKASEANPKEEKAAEDEASSDEDSSEDTEAATVEPEAKAPPAKAPLKKPRAGKKRPKAN